jgi:2-polyprenyl-3-methyl-5-hydroxy-6-metoxy-1,4-benzoquinol methylase
MKEFNFENPADREDFMDYKETNPAEAQEIIDTQRNEAESYALLHQYDKISLEYALATVTDPNKRFVQYPEALRLIGELKGKSALDIGCANGTFTRMIASGGAEEIVAFEPSEVELEKAKESEKENPQGIRYISGYGEIPAEKKFDVVTAIMVIPAVNEQQMEEIFAQASKFIKDGGRFVALTLNPEFKRFGEVVNNRKFSIRPDGRIDIGFYNENGENYMNIIDTDFSKEDIEKIAAENDFSKMEWKTLKVCKEGLEKMGSEFWNGYEEDCPYVGFVAYKA